MERIRQKLTSTRHNLEQLKKDGRIDDIAYQVLKKSNDEAINFTGSSLLLNKGSKLSFEQWKQANGYRIQGNDLYRWKTLTFTEVEVFEHYKEYLNEPV